MNSIQEDHALALRVEGLTASSMHAYVLFDGALCPANRRPWLQRTHRVIIAPRTSPGSVAPALPYLADFGTLSAIQRGETVALARETSGITWIGSALDISELAHALSCRMEAMLQQDVPVFLRLADARVLPVIRKVLQGQQAQQFFSIADAWCHLDRQHNLAQLECHPAAIDTFNAPLVLSEEQEEAMLEAAEPDAVLKLLIDFDEPAVNKILPFKRYDYVKQQLSRAQEWGVIVPKEQAIYCMLSLEYGPEFDKAGEWPIKLGEVRTGRTTLAQLMRPTT
jgi:hypothetical protein